MVTATDGGWHSDTAAFDLRPLKAGLRPEGLGTDMPGMGGRDAPEWLGMKGCPENLLPQS